MPKFDFKNRVLEEPDFIKSLGCGNSLSKYLSENTQTLSNSTIARLLKISEEEVEEIYQDSICKLREGMVELEDGQD